MLTLSPSILKKIEFAAIAITVLSSGLAFLSAFFPSATAITIVSAFLALSGSIVHPWVEKRLEAIEEAEREAMQAELTALRPFKFPAEQIDRLREYLRRAPAKVHVLVMVHGRSMGPGRQIVKAFSDAGWEVLEGQSLSSRPDQWINVQFPKGTDRTVIRSAFDHAGLPVAEQQTGDSELVVMVGDPG